MNIFILVALIVMLSLFMISNQQTLENSDDSQSNLSVSKINKNFMVDKIGIFVVNDENYDTFIKEFKYVFLFSFRHPCKMCMQVLPEIEKIVNPLQKLESPIYVGKLNMTDCPIVSKRLNLINYFSLKYISEGMPMEYNGGRYGEDIVIWAREKFNPIIGEIKTPEEINQIRKFSEIVVIFFGDSEEKYNQFFKNVKAKDRTIFLRCASNECLKKYNSENGDIFAFKKSEKNPSILKSKDYNEKSLRNSLEELIRLRVLKFDSHTAKLIFSQQQPGLFLYRSHSDSGVYDHIIDELYEDAKRFNLKLIVTDIVENHETKLAHIMNFQALDLPKVVIHDTSSKYMRNYVMDNYKKINKENILKFINDYRNNNLSPHKKSQRVPEVQKDPAYTLVGSTLEQFVMDPSKDVVVMFYAPWCKNSKVLYPTYNDIAKKFKDNPNLLMAKFDAYNNDSLILGIEFFPLIAIWPSHNKNSPVVFKDDYSDPENILRFINENSYNKIYIENENSESKNQINEEMNRLEKEYEEQTHKNSSDF